MAGVDVDRSLRIAAVEVAVGGIPVIRDQDMQNEKGKTSPRQPNPAQG